MFNTCQYTATTGRRAPAPTTPLHLLFCRAVISWLASLKSCGFSSFYNLIVLMGAQEAWRWWRICASRAGIPQHCLFSLAVPHVIRKLCSLLHPGGWCGFSIADFELLPSPCLLPSPWNGRSCIERKLILALIPSNNHCCSAALKPWGLVRRLRNGTEEKAAAKGRDGKGKGFLPSPLLFVYWHGTNLIS